MKSFLSLALLGVLANAQTPQEDDAKAKAAVVAKEVDGVTVGTWTNVIAGDAWTLKDGLKNSGTLTASTSWNRTGGTDSQDIFGVHWKFAPSAKYTIGSGQFEFAMAKDAFASPCQMTRFTATVVASSTLHTYNWNNIGVTIPDWVKAKGVLDLASEALLKTKSFRYFWDTAGKFVAQDKMSDVAAWQISTESSYDPKTGGYNMIMTRNNAGPAEVKTGGAVYTAMSYKDDRIAKMVTPGGYIKFADDHGAHGHDGATALTTYGALVLAAVYSLF